MNFYTLLTRFIPQYKWRIITYVVLNILSSSFSAFGYLGLIPLIQILFGLSETTFSYIDLDSVSSYSEILKVMENNISFWLQEQMVIYGRVWTLFAIGFFIIFMSLMGNVISYVAYWVRIPIRTGISRDLRQDAYNRIVQMPCSAFSKENRGDFTSRMTNDVEEIEYGIGTTLDMCIKDPIQIFVFIITLYGISKSLTFYGIMSLLIVCGIVIALSAGMQKISLKAQTNRGKILSFFEQTLGNLLMIKSYNAENKFCTTFKALNYETQKIFNWQNRFYSLAWPITDFLSIVFLVSLLCIGGRMILNNESDIAPAALITFLGVFYSLISPLRDMMKCTFGIRKAIASVKRLNKVMSIDNESHLGHLEIDMASANKNQLLFNLQGVTFSYDEKQILDNINMKIYRGQRIAIIGPTGSGKSSLAKLLTKHHVPSSGNISLLNKNLCDYSNTSVRDNIVYVPSDALLLNDTIFNNITIGKTDATFEEVIEVAKIMNIHDFINSLPEKYDTLVGDRGTALSSGQCQCIALARMILKNPPIIILDESTSSLDPNLELSILDIMKNKIHTSVIITHRVSTTTCYDYIFVINEGRITEHGTPAQLLTKGSLYKRMLLSKTEML